MGAYIKLVLPQSRYPKALLASLIRFMSMDIYFKLCQLLVVKKAWNANYL